jgi:hypothetical protein
VFHRKSESGGMECNTYLQQSSAHSNSTSKDFTKLLARVLSSSPGTHWHTFKAFIYKLSRCEQWRLCSKYIYSFVLLTSKTKKENGYGYVESIPFISLSPSFSVPVIASSLSFRRPCRFIIPLISSSLSSSHSHSLSLLYTPVIILISTHNTSYEQWLIGMGVGAGCSSSAWRW